MHSLQIFLGLILALSVARCGIVAKGLSAKSEEGEWNFSATQGPYVNGVVSARFSVKVPASSMHYYGMSWNVWPDTTYSDGGYEVGLKLRATDASGYRVQVSTQYQDIALVKYPMGGYLQAVSYPFAIDSTYDLDARMEGNRVLVRVNGELVIDYIDAVDPILTPGNYAAGVGNGATVLVTDNAIFELPASSVVEGKPHDAHFRVRTWLGFRPWIFDGNEPILMLPTPRSTYINSVKLSPGYKPLLSWNSTWDTSNQGALPEGAMVQSPVTVSGEGSDVTVSWKAEQMDHKYEIATALRVGYEPARNVYTYDVDGQLALLGSHSFDFRYGYDFEHHDTLHPFFYQYMVVRGADDELIHQPFSIGSTVGGFPELKQSGGMRLWYGYALHPLKYFPAVEYSISSEPSRIMKMAICQAAFDTGAFFLPENAGPGTRVPVRYRYTGYPAQEAKEIFEASHQGTVPGLESNTQVE